MSQYQDGNPYGNQQNPQGQYQQTPQGQYQQADNVPVYSRAQVVAWQQQQMAMLQKGIDDVQQQARAKSHRTAAVTALIGLVVGVLAAIVLARFVFGWGTTKLDPVAPALADTELSCVVGTYTYNGETFDITAREAIEGTQSLSYSLNADGTYDAPSSDMVLAYARNQVLAQIAADAGITASADEVNAYMQQLVGTTDITQAAAYLHMDVDQAQTALQQACAISKLKDSVCPASAQTLQEPVWPSDGNTELGHPEYADYIIGLLGANWDATTQSWANTDNDYYAVLKDQVFAQGSASYNAAMLAYNVAYQQAGGTAGDSSAAWTAYVNTYLDTAAIVIYTLRA